MNTGIKQGMIFNNATSQHTPIASGSAMHDGRIVSGTHTSGGTVQHTLQACENRAVDPANTQLQPDNLDVLHILLDYSAEYDKFGRIFDVDYHKRRWIDRKPVSPNSKMETTYIEWLQTEGSHTLEDLITILRKNRMNATANQVEMLRDQSKPVNASVTEIRQENRIQSDDSEILSILLKHSHEWDDCGREWRVPYHIRESLRENRQKTPDECMKVMFQEFCSKSPQTLKTLEASLRSLKRNGTADQIKALESRPGNAYQQPVVAPTYVQQQSMISPPPHHNDLSQLAHELASHGISWKMLGKELEISDCVLKSISSNHSLDRFTRMERVLNEVYQSKKDQTKTEIITALKEMGFDDTAAYIEQVF